MRDIDAPDEGMDLHATPETSLQQNLPGEAIITKFCDCGLEKGSCDLTCKVVSPTEGE
jgi:hypothetical protein